MSLAASKFQPNA